MKKLFNILLAFSLALICSVTTGCSSDRNEVKGILNQAKELIDKNQIDEARDLCGTLQAMTEKMTATDYSALALLYMQLVEHSDNNIDDISAALTAYNSAVALNNTETQEYFSSINDSDGQRRIMLLFSLAGALQMPDDITSIDSIPGGYNILDSLTSN